MIVNAFIQARLGSTRLPRKVMQTIGNDLLIDYVYKRVRKSKYINNIILCTTNNEEDDALTEHYYRSLNNNIYRGDAKNVLERFYWALQEYPCDYIVRVTADDPLKDPEIIDRCISEVLIDPAIDYCSNTIDPSFPEGLDVEVIKTSAFIKSYQESTLISEKEHVTPYIWKNPDKFNLQNITHSENLSGWRWTVDNINDLEFVKAIFKHFNWDMYVSYVNVIDYIKHNPEIMEINNGIIRNEGYIKSLIMENYHE